MQRLFTDMPPVDRVHGPVSPRGAWIDRWCRRAALARLGRFDCGRLEIEAMGFGEAFRRRWRMFFMACEELFAFDGGRERLVGHYRFRPGMS